MAIKKTDLVKEIASRAQSVDYWSFGHHLPNPDPVLKRMGKDISVYRELLSDPHVRGCVRRRKAAIKSLEWQLTTSGNEKVDEQLEQLLKSLNPKSLMSEMLDATLFGYQALEVIWTSDDGLWIPNKIIGKPQEWFTFDDENQLRLRTKEHRLEGIAVPPKKFLLIRQEATYMNPYGQGDLSSCFWPATFKKGGFKFWLEFVEKYGSPWLVGKHPRQAKASEIEELLDSLDSMLGTAVAGIPDDSSIDVLESASKSASSDVFREFLEHCKAEIAIALLGQNQTTEAEANRASATAGLEVTREIRDDDATLVEGAFNELIRWYCELNFATLESIPEFELFEQESIDKLQAERDGILFNIGVRFNKQYLERIYGFEDGDIELMSATEESYGTEENVAFAEEKHSHPADDISEQLASEATVYIDDWLKELRERLLAADSLESFNVMLTEAIPELSLTEYADMMSLANHAAYMHGRLSVQEEAKRD